MGDSISFQACNHAVPLNREVALQDDREVALPGIRRA
jgi:hypothetical protein